MYPSGVVGMSALVLAVIWLLFAVVLAVSKRPRVSWFVIALVGSVAVGVLLLNASSVVVNEMRKTLEQSTSLRVVDTDIVDTTVTVRGANDCGRVILTAVVRFDKKRDEFGNRQPDGKTYVRRARSERLTPVGDTGIPCQ